MKRDHRENKRLRDGALKEVGVQTPIKDTEENHRKVEEVNHEVENRSISHPLAKSSKKSMMDHFKTVESPTPRAAKTRLQSNSKLQQKNIE